LELRIEKLIYGGDGLARLPADERGRGKAVFLPFVLEGERVEALVTDQKQGFARARATDILQASQHRTEPACPYFGACGGCHYQHSRYEHQLAVKTSILRENLRRIAKLELPCELKVHASPPWEYRNRTRLRVRTRPEFALGYFRHASHEFLPVEKCPISSPLINQAIGTLSEAGRRGSFDAGLREIEFFADAADERVLVEAYCVPGAANGSAEQLASRLQGELGQATSITVFPALPGSDNAAYERRPLVQLGVGNLEYQTALGSYRVSAGSFFQTNRHLVDELVNIVTLGRSGRTAADLYAGVGLFSTVLSREFERVIAVESSLQSYADLTYNVLDHVKTVRSTVQRYLVNATGSLNADLIVVDPPRDGLGGRVAAMLGALHTPMLTYVSCDPATLSRDLVVLLAAGYHVDEAHLVDLFPQTFHVESVFHLKQ
jgi:23S rRNA (uracil1939-C5)-methyltransferase